MPWFGAMRGDRAFTTLRPTKSDDAAKAVEDASKGA